jgi:hypothetical protein
MSYSHIISKIEEELKNPAFASTIRVFKKGDKIKLSFDDHGLDIIDTFLQEAGMDLYDDSSDAFWDELNFALAKHFKD